MDGLIFSLVDSVFEKDTEQTNGTKRSLLLSPASEPFHPLFDALKTSGLEARKSNALEGRSGASHSFTIVADYHGIEDEQKLVVVDIIVDPVCVDARAVRSFFSKALDCGLKHRILVAIPELDSVGKVLARNYDIPFIEAKKHSIAQVAEKLQLILKSQPFRQDGQLAKQNGFGQVAQEQRVRTAVRQPTRKRGSFDIMADILTVVSTPSSKTEVMSCANLSYDQCRKYLPALEKLGLMERYLEDGLHFRFAITEKGREYLSKMSAEYGHIANGDKSVWSTRRRAGIYDDLVKKRS